MKQILRIEYLTHQADVVALNQTGEMREMEDSLQSESISIEREMIRNEAVLKLFDEAERLYENLEVIREEEEKEASEKQMEIRRDQETGKSYIKKPSFLNASSKTPIPDFPATNKVPWQKGKQIDNKEETIDSDPLLEDMEGDSCSDDTVWGSRDALMEWARQAQYSRRRVFKTPFLEPVYTQATDNPKQWSSEPTADLSQKKEITVKHISRRQNSQNSHNLFFKPSKGKIFIRS